MAQTFAALGSRWLFATKLDVARRLGGVLAAADAGLALAEAGIGPTIGRGLGALSPAGLARLLVRGDPGLGPSESRAEAGAAGRDAVSRVLAIGSGKGGVGKTWLAVSLAHALARLGRRVLLFDGDLGLANVDVQLGLDPGPDLAGVLDRPLHLRAGGAAVRAGRVRS